MVNWRCAHCQTTIESGWDVCWNCGGGRDGSPPSGEFEKTRDELGEEPVPRDRNFKALNCLRCQSPMQPMDEVEFVVGDISVGKAMFGYYANSEKLNLDGYVCNSCGKVELFLNLE